MQFIDSHCHLDFPAFDADRIEVLERCALLGIKNIIIPGVAPEKFSRSLALCQRFPNLYCATGLHPWWISDYFSSDLNEADIQFALEELAFHYDEKYCVAIGECGLDSKIAVPFEIQKAVLIEHIEIANSLQAPLILHCVGHHNEMLQTLKQHKCMYGGVLHAFSGSYELAMQYWDRGFYLGVGGTISYERAQKTRETIKKMPLESILLETDAPDMPLEGGQGKRNSPENIVRIAKLISEIKQSDVSDVAQSSIQNAMTLFSKLGNL